MALLASDKGGEGFEPLPAGTYVARCISVVDLGVQETPWGGKEKVHISFEVPGERVEWKDSEGNDKEGPALIGNRYTLSIHPDSNLGQHLISWRGKPFTEEERAGFDLFTVLGAPCMISVIHNEKNGKTYANIQSIMRLPKGTDCPAAETELIAYTPNDVEHAKNLDKLPEWQQKLVRQGFKMDEGATVGSASQPTSQPPSPPPVDDFDDDIPF